MLHNLTHYRAIPSPAWRIAVVILVLVDKWFLQG
jgi:hypothetical protein